MITAKEAKVKTAGARKAMCEQELLDIERIITEAASEGKETVCLESISDDAVKKLSELGYKLSFETTFQYSSGELGHTCCVSWSD